MRRYFRNRVLRALHRDQNGRKAAHGGYTNRDGDSDVIHGDLTHHGGVARVVVNT